MKLELTEEQKRQIDEGARIIKKGGVVAFPTETVYGLGANAYDENAVKKIFEIKGRPQDNPLIVHILKKEDIFIVAREIPEKVIALAEKFWPGPLTVVLFKNPAIPDIVTAGLDTVAVRVPAHPVALYLIERAGVPIAAPSANISGKPSATTSEHVKKYFGNKVFIIEGETLYGIESTVIDFTEEPPKVLRPGALPIEEIKKVIGEVQIYKGNTGKPKSPGMKYKHYSPDAKLILFTNREKLEDIIKEEIREKRKSAEKKPVNKKICVVLFRNKIPEIERKFEGKADFILSGKSYKEVAKNLFKILIEIGDKYDTILFEGLKEKGVGLGIMNRLKKAADKIVE